MALQNKARVHLSYYNKKLLTDITILKKKIKLL